MFAPSSGVLPEGVRVLLIRLSLFCSLVGVEHGILFDT